MAKKKSSGSKNYGRGEQDANPFYGGENSEFMGKPYTIVSPHGSEFGVDYLVIGKTNDMARAIDAEEWNGGIRSGGKVSK